MALDLCRSLQAFLGAETKLGRTFDRTTMQVSLPVIQCVMVLSLLGLSLGLIATSEIREKTHDRLLVGNIVNVFEKIGQAGIRDKLLYDGLVGISRPLHKEATHSEKMVTNSKLLQKKLIRANSKLRQKKLIRTNSKLWQKKLIRAISKLRRKKMILGNLLKNKKGPQGEKMVTNCKFLRKKMILGELLQDKNIRRRQRRGMGYRMHCVPSTKKVCKKIKYKGEKTQWCTMVAFQKCYAID